MTETFSIIEAQFTFLAGLAGHHLLAQRNPAGEIMGELDGLAMGRDGSIKPVGYSPCDRLKVFHFQSTYLYAPGLPQCEVYAGSQQEVFNRWDAALDAANAINELDLHYPFLGLGKNSNSVASTLIAAMKLTEPEIPGAAPILPGKGVMLLSETVLAEIWHRHHLDPIYRTPHLATATGPARRALTTIFRPDGRHASADILANVGVENTAANSSKPDSNTAAVPGETVSINRES